jgi:poly(3-hydroxybutyrate) depolymerase
MSGEGGGLTVLPGDQDSAIQVGLSYVYDDGACFADGYANTPDLPYFDAVLAEVEAEYCVERSQVFVAGFSSGAWEAYMLGCARGGVVRGIATAAGGLREERPPCSGIPAAALLLTGAQDDANPITKVGSNGFDTGSAAARDAVLMLNGCVGTTTAEWPFYPTCQRYTGCPEAYPVIWCTPPGGHMDGGADYKTAIARFWSSLPDR